MPGEPDQFRVSPSTGGLPMLDAPAVQNAGPEQIQKLGQAIGQAGATGSAIFEDQLKLANQAKVDDATNMLKERELDLTYGDQGYTRLKGEQALTRPDGKSLDEEYVGQLDKHAEEISAGLSNDAQRREFAHTTRGLANQMRARVLNHKDGEFVNYHSSVYDGTIALGQRELALGGADPSRTESATNAIREAVARKGRLVGEAAVEIERQTQQALTVGHVAVIKQFIDHNDPSAAERYYDMHKTEMTEQGMMAVDGAIGEAQDMQVSTQKATQIYAGGVGEAGAAAPHDVLMPVRGGVSGAFGQWRAPQPGVAGHKHAGVDIPVPAGTAVMAPIDGIAHRKENPGGYGHYYTITSPDGKTEVRLAHLSEFGVKDGEQVTRGTVVGKSGGARGAPGAGDSTGPHVHYELRINGTPVDPTGKHQTPGQGSGTASLETMIMNARNDPQLTSSPKRLAETERQIRSMYSAHEEAKQNSKQDAIDAGYKAVAQAGGDMSKIPPSVMAALPGHALAGLKNFSDDLKSPRPEGEPDLLAYGKLREGIITGKITRPEDIAPYIPRIGKSLAKALIDDVTGLKQAKPEVIDSAKTAKAGLEFIDSRLKGIGVDEKKNLPEYNLFRGKYLDQIARAERAKGKGLTLQEANEIGTSMLALAVDNKTGATLKTRGYQLERPVIDYRSIPPAARQAIEQSLVRRGVKPDPETVRHEYYRATQAIGSQ